jgi:hypothetical protein
MKHQHLVALRNRSAVQQFVDSAAAEMTHPADLVINLSDAGIELDLDALAGAEAPRPVVAEGHAGFEWLTRRRFEQMAPGSTAVVIFSKRMLSLHPSLWDLRRWCARDGHRFEIRVRHGPLVDVTEIHRRRAAGLAEEPAT